MERLAYLLIVVLDALVIIDILRGNKDTEKKIIWVLLVIFLPVLGPVLYVIIGRKR